MDRATFVTLVLVLTPVLISSSVAVWTVVVGRRQRERDARQEDRLLAVEHTRRDVAAQMRYLASLARLQPVEGLEATFGPDVYPRADVALIGDPQALETFLDFDARARAHFAVGAPFIDDVGAAVRIVQGVVDDALAAQAVLVRAGKEPRTLPAESLAELDPHRRWERQQALEEELRKDHEPWVIVG